MTLPERKNKSGPAELIRAETCVLNSLKSLPLDMPLDPSKFVAKILSESDGFGWDDINEAVWRLIAKGIFEIRHDWLLQIKKGNME